MYTQNVNLIKCPFLRSIIISNSERLILELWKGSKSLETCSLFWGSAFIFLGLSLPIRKM